jgi:transcriptional regulator with XRE-family HTH domain
MSKHDAEPAEWKTEARVARLKLVRVLYGESQQEFAARIGVPYKRWNRYELGASVPRDAVFNLYEKIGLSPEWVWFGRTGNLTKEWRERIQNGKAVAKQIAAAEAEVAAAEARLAEARARRKRVGR